MNTNPSTVTRQHQLTLTTNGHEVTQQLEAFKREHGITILIAFCGSADMKVELINELLSKIIKKLSQFTQVAFLTGGTRDGVPEVATHAANEYGAKVISVVPACAKPQNLLEDVDLRITVDPQGYDSVWGSESALMIGLADALVLLNGGAGTLVELALALKINSGRIQVPKPSATAKASRRPVIIAPVSGFGGVADLTQVLLATSLIKFDFWERTFPPRPLRNETDVADYLIHALDLYETIE